MTVIGEVSASSRRAWPAIASTWPELISSANPAISVVMCSHSRGTKSRPARPASRAWPSRASSATCGLSPTRINHISRARPGSTPGTGDQLSSICTGSGLRDPPPLADAARDTPRLRGEKVLLAGKRRCPTVRQARSTTPRSSLSVCAFHRWSATPVRSGHDQAQRGPAVTVPGLSASCAAQGRPRCTAQW